jgi:hypothetical protein
MELTEERLAEIDTILLNTRKTCDLRSSTRHVHEVCHELLAEVKHLRAKVTALEEQIEVTWKD